jgi:hypothetical protein
MSVGVTGAHDLLLAETLGLAMARRAADILDRHRLALTSGAPTADDTVGCEAQAGDDAQFAADNAIFTAVLDAANECLGRFDTRPADDRWCDALLQVIHLGQLAQLSSGVPAPRTPRCEPRRPRTQRPRPYQGRHGSQDLRVGPRQNAPLKVKMV